MRTILAGLVTADTLDTAVMFGIEPTSFLWNAENVELDWLFFEQPVKVMPWNQWKTSLSKEACIRTSHYAMVAQAEALVLKGESPHLLRLADLKGLLIYHER